MCLLTYFLKISSLHFTFGYNFIFKGDPKGFVTILDEHGLPRGLIPRYRGNRLHILFIHVEL